MWEKVIVGLAVFLGVFSLGYAAYNGKTDAASPSFQLAKGQKVVLATYRNKAIIWDIGNNTSNYVRMSGKPLKEKFQKYNDSIGCTIVYLKGAAEYVKNCSNMMPDNELTKMIVNGKERWIC